MDQLEKDAIEHLLGLTGELLRERNSPTEIVTIGGASLLLLGLIRRSTVDLDVIGEVRDRTIVRLEVLPAALAQAASDVARFEGVSPSWLNTEPSSVVEQGLPAGFLSRCRVMRYGGLTVHVASRVDQLWLKLMAAVDRGEPHGKHARDLRELKPTEEELRAAAEICVVHDPSLGFRENLMIVLQHYGVEDVG